jgi:hypothetical protein
VTGAGGLNESLTVSYANNVNAGTATASASYPGSSNYLPSTDTETFTIDKADAAVVVSWADSTYDGNPNAASAVANGVAGETGLSPAPTLTYYSGPTATGTPLAGAPTAAGTYTVQADFAGNGNYNPASNTRTITIEKAPTTTTVTCTAGPFVYNGSPHTPCSASVTGAGGLNESLTVNYANNVNAGTATANASYPGSSNYLPSTDTETFTIEKADQMITFTSPAPSGAIVGDTYTPTATGGGSGNPVTFGASGACSYSTGIVTATTGGTCTVNANQAGNENYNPAPEKSQTFEVAKRPTTTTVTCGDPVQVNAQMTCMVIVTDTGPATTVQSPQGQVSFTTAAGAVGSCTLAATGPASSQCSASFTASTPSVHSVTANYQGSSVHLPSASAVSAFAVFYDPSAGFVTGGGWITSPAEAYVANASLSGRANFGFVSKYEKGAKIPTGQTEFQFQLASLNFHSTAYEWLVVSGTSKAQYKGVGKINGSGNYGFLLTAYDGTPDRFRIKIWNKDASDAVVYDNGLGGGDDIDAATPQPINGGSIVIHTGGKK